MYFIYGKEAQYNDLRILSRALREMKMKHIVFLSNVILLGRF